MPLDPLCITSPGRPAYIYLLPCPPQAMPLKKDDPMQFYTDMRKLGQGASGTVFVGTDLRTGEASSFA